MELYRRDIQRDVQELGALVGDVIAEQGSSEDLEAVESIREAAVEYRDGRAEDRAELRSVPSTASTGKRGAASCGTC